LCEYSILAEVQFGFKADSSTNKAFYKLINETLQAINNKSPVSGFFISKKRLTV
jgi:hypothetical protein